MTAFRDLTNQKFNRLTAIKIARKTGGNVVWLWECECGSRVEAPGNRVTGGNTKSCGCLAKEIISSLRKTHGKTKTPEYVSYANMIARCEYQGRRDYRHYGGRGIKVCERWRHSFENFLVDMGPRPNLRSTLERKEVNGDYSPENCIWVSQKRQTRNKRNNHLLTMDGKTQSMADWADEYGITGRMLWSRMFRLGWTMRDALTRSKSHRWSRRKVTP